MTVRRFLLIGTVLFLAVALWLIVPIYQFYGHRGVVPLGPFGWTSLPDDVPEEQRLYDPAYGAAAAQAMDALRHHRERLQVPALSAAVAFRGELVWAGTAGWQDLRTSTPASPDTRFRIGSTSKALTATALARLVDAGVMDLDKPIGDYLEPLPNPFWSDITPRMLASHMAGLPHYGENTDRVGLYRSIRLGTHYASMIEALDVFDGSELLYRPGTEFHYSSLGTVLLGAVMGAADGRSYRAVMQEQVFDPLGLHDTIVAPRGAEGTPNMATSYVRKGDAFRPWRPVDLTHRLPGGGWAATSSDLVRLGAAWLDDGYIQSETRSRFWTPQRLDNGEVNPQDYAIGFRMRSWEVDGVGPVHNANHGGVSRGAMSWLLVFPDHDLVLAFNTNAKPSSGEFSDFGVAWSDLFAAFARSAGPGSDR